MRKIILLILIAVALVLAGYWGGVYWTYSWFTRQIHELTGLDIAASKLLAIVALSIVSAIPSSALIFPFTSAARRRFAWLAVAIAATLWTAGLSYLRREVNFSPEGIPQKTYVNTPDGPVIKNTSEPGIDPTTGRKREPLTPQRYNEIDLYRKHATEPPTPGPGGHNFNRVTGESQAWILLQVDGCVTSPTKIYDEATGRPFEQITDELAEKCRTREAQAEKKKAQEAEKKQRHDEEDARRTRRARFEEPGIYSSHVHFWTIQGVRLSVRETVVFRDHVIIPVELSSASSEDGQQRAKASRVTFAIVREDGLEATCSESTTEALGEADLRGAGAPQARESDPLVLNCPRENASGHFALTLDHRPVFRVTSYPWAFRPF